MIRPATLLLVALLGFECASRPDPIPGRCFDPSKAQTCADVQDCAPADGCSVVPACEHSSCVMFGVDEARCEAAANCAWDGYRCRTPSPDPCAALTFDTCSTSSNCAAIMACQGTLIVCDPLNQTECEATPHCIWYPATTY